MRLKDIKAITLNCGIVYDKEYLRYHFEKAADIVNHAKSLENLIIEFMYNNKFCESNPEWNRDGLDGDTAFYMKDCDGCFKDDRDILFRYSVSFAKASFSYN